MARQYLEMEKENMPLAEREKLTLGSLRRAVFDGDLDTGSFMSARWQACCTRSSPCVRSLRK